MIVDYHPRFAKDLHKLTVRQQQKAQAHVQLFIDDRSHVLLKDHSLKGRYQGYRSFSVGGDLRIVYKLVTDNHAVLVKIGTHSQLYG